MEREARCERGHGRNKDTGRSTDHDVVSSQSLFPWVPVTWTGRQKNLLEKLISTALVSGLEVSMSWRDKWQQLLGCGGTGVKPAIAQLGQCGRVLASWGAHRRAVTQRCCHSSPPRDELKEQRPGSNETLPLTTGLQRVCSLPGPGTCCELMLG